MFGVWIAGISSQVLFPAGAAEEVEWEVGATLSFEPDINISSGAVVAFASSTLPTTWVSPLDVIVKLQGEGVAQLTFHHLTVFFSSLKKKT